MNDFISIHNFLPALNMLCDIKLVNGDIKKARLIQQSEQAPFLVWIDNFVNKEGGTLAAIPPEFIEYWRYDENTNEDEFKKWATDVFKPVNKSETV